MKRVVSFWGRPDSLGPLFWGSPFAELTAGLGLNVFSTAGLIGSRPSTAQLSVVSALPMSRAMLTVHFLPGYASDLNPDELVWSHVRRTGTARRPLLAGEKLRDKIEDRLAKLQQMPGLVRSFFRHPSVAYIADC